MWSLEKLQWLPTTEMSPRFPQTHLNQHRNILWPLAAGTPLLLGSEDGGLWDKQSRLSLLFL